MKMSELIQDPYEVPYTLRRSGPELVLRVVKLIDGHKWTWTPKGWVALLGPMPKEES